MKFESLASDGCRLVMRMSERIYRVTRNADVVKALEDLRRTEHLITKRSDGSFYCQKHSCPPDDCASRLTTDVIWTSSLDGGTYVATVLRTKPYQGTLTLLCADRCVLQRNVTISYNAPYGPDGEDVYDWKRLCIEAADADHKRRRKASS